MPSSADNSLVKASRPSRKIFCIDCRNEAVPIEVSQPYPTVLKCENKLYEIDPEYRSVFKIENCHTINICPTSDALYTMFRLEEENGTYVETWHDRWKPVDFSTLVVPNETGRLLLNEVAPIVQSAALEIKDNAPSSGRRKRKAALLETAMLAVMELVDMQNEEENSGELIRLQEEPLSFVAKIAED